MAFHAAAPKFISDNLSYIISLCDSIRQDVRSGRTARSPSLTMPDAPITPGSPSRFANVDTPMEDAPAAPSASPTGAAANNASPSAKPQPQQSHASAEVPYNRDFEDSVMRVILEPPAAADGIESRGPLPAFLLGRDAVPHSELPLPLDDSRRLYKSLVPGIRLTHPTGAYEGGNPEPADEDRAWTKAFLEKYGVRTKEDLERAKAQAMEEAMEDLRHRMRARKEASEEREKTERDLKALNDQREVELKAQRSIIEKAKAKKEERRAKKTRLGPKDEAPAETSAASAEEAPTSEPQTREPPTKPASMRAAAMRTAARRAAPTNYGDLFQLSSEHTIFSRAREEDAKRALLNSSQPTVSSPLSSRSSAHARSSSETSTWTLPSGAVATRPTATPPAAMPPIITLTSPTPPRETAQVSRAGDEQSPFRKVSGTLEERKTRNNRKFIVLDSDDDDADDEEPPQPSQPAQPAQPARRATPKAKKPDSSNFYKDERRKRD